MQNHKHAIFAVVLTISALFYSAIYGAEARIKDLVEFDGVRGNDLVGYGLVVGLNGTGDGMRNSPFTEEALANLLERLGINVAGEQFRPKNVAAVLVTATLPPFARAGGQIDVSVSAIGDSKSLLGGTLIMTPLSAADGNIYAVDVLDGSALWPSPFSAGGKVVGSGAAYQEGAVFATDEGKIFMINLNKEPKTIANLETPIYSAINFVGEQIIFAPASEASLLTAYDLNGFEAWAFLPTE